MWAFISVFHTLNLSLFLVLTYTHAHFFQDVTLGIKPLMWFYSAAETSCRLSSPGSQSGSDMDIHTHTHTHRHKYTCTHFCDTSSNTYKFSLSPSHHRHTHTLTESFQHRQIYPCLFIARLYVLWHIPQSYCTSDCFRWATFFLPQASLLWGVCQHFLYPSSGSWVELFQSYSLVVVIRGCSVFHQTQSHTWTQSVSLSRKRSPLSAAE